MIKIDVSDDFEKASRHLMAMSRKHLPFATALALTRTAEKAKEIATQGIQHSLSSPAPQTQKSIFIQGAKKASLIATVGIKDMAPARGIEPAKYLQGVVAGGKRVPKRFERALIHAGILPAGMFVVPARGQKLDQYGNLPGPLHKQILADLRLVGPRAQTRRRFVVIPPGEETHAGVYLEHGRGKLRKLSPVLLFVGTPTYEAIFPFGDIVTRAVQKHFPIEFAKAWRQALATAR